MKENTDFRRKPITNLKRALDPDKEINIKTQTKGIQLHEGMKIVVNDVLFDLCGKEPQNNMDIYITEDGKLCCEQPDNYWCHFIGSVKLNSTSYFYTAYSIYIVAIVKGDRKPVQGGVELATKKQKERITGT